MPFFGSIRPASYKGVPFGVLDASDSRGRNTVTHAFPLRDKVFVEDLGRAQRTIQLTAFVVGEGYALRRDALIAALESPGPGTLVHPWLGTFEVSLSGPVSVEHSAESGGYCSFQLSFVEDWAPESPGVSLAWPSLSALNALAAVAEICSVLDAVFEVAAAVEEALAPIVELAQAITAPLKALYGIAVSLPAIGQAVSAAVSLIAKAGGVAALLSGFWPARDYRYLPDAQIRKEASFFAGRCVEAEALSVPAGQGSVRTQIASNRKAVADFDRMMSGVAALSALAFVSPMSSSDADWLRNLATEVADRLLFGAATVNQFKAFRKLHVSVQRAMAEAAGQAPKVYSIEENQVNPALAVAWRQALSLTGGNDLEATFFDLVRRNGVVHPGFVPAGKLEVLRG